MKFYTKVSLGLISSALALSLATASDNDGMASSQSHEKDCDSKSMMKGNMSMVPAEKVKQHLSELKAKLNLTKDQEPAFQTFSDQVNEQAKSMMSMQEKMKGDMPKTAPDRVAMMADASKSQAQNMATMVDTVKTFYGALNSEQQATFDKIQLSHMSNMHDMHQ